MKKIICLLMVIISVFGLCGCKEEEKVGLERVIDNGKFVVGFTEFPPFGYMEDGEYLGFDLEVAKLVCNELGVTFVGKYIDWDAQVLEIQTNVDCIWNAMTITETRKENMLFSKVYWETDLVAVTLKDSKYTNVDELIGKTIAVEANGTADINLSESSDYTVVRYTTVSEALLAVKSGAADAIVADQTYVTTVLEKNSEDYKGLTGTVGDIEQYGIAFRLEETDLKNKVDEIIDKLYKDGKLDSLLEKYFGETNGFFRE